MNRLMTEELELGFRGGDLEWQPISLDFRAVQLGILMSATGLV